MGRSLIACCSDGVRISFWTSLVCSFCEIAMTQWIANRKFSFALPPAKTILIQPEVGPQINPAYVLIAGQCIGSTASKDNAIVHDVCPVGDPQRLAHVVIGDEHADA